MASIYHPSASGVGYPRASGLSMGSSASTDYTEEVGWEVCRSEDLTGARETPQTLEPVSKTQPLTRFTTSNYNSLVNDFSLTNGVLTAR